LLVGENGQTLVATTTDSYTVATTSNGCAGASSAPASVTVNPKPDATISTPSSIYLGASATTSVNAPSGGETFAWRVSNGTCVSGGGTRSIVFNTSAPGTLTLTVAVTNSSACTDTKQANVSVQFASFGAPPYLKATATGTTSIAVQWASVAGADHYEIER